MTHMNKVNGMDTIKNNRIEINYNDYDILWIDDELIGLRYCPICKHKYYPGDSLLVSIYEDNPYKCVNCHTKFLMRQEVTLYRLEDENTKT